MSENQILSKQGLIIIIICTIIVTTIGIILLILGYNEAFYLNYTLIQAIFLVITNLGDTVILILIIAIFYTVYDKKFAKNLALSLMLSVYVNEFLKEIFKDPRPPGNVDGESEFGYIETSYGFPSGHTQNAVAVWGYVGYEFRNKSKHLLVSFLTSFLIFLIAISRIIIGAHDLQDIVGGFVIGICLLILFIYLEPILTPKFNSLKFSLKIIIVVVISVGIFIIGTLLFPAAGLGLLKNPPLHSDAGNFAVIGGALLGLGSGYLIECKYIKYNPSELNKKQKILNLTIGITIFIGSYYFLDLIISGNVFLRFIRYAIVSFILTFIIPLIYTKINRK